MTSDIKSLLFDPAISLSPDEWAPVAAEKVVEGTPQAAARVLYESPDGRFCTGIYACTAGKWGVAYEEDEFCRLIEGSVRLTDESGASHTYTAPDSFLIPSGFKGFWEPLGNLRKFFVIYLPGV